MRIFGGDRLKNMMGKLGWEEGENLTNRFMSKAVERAQVRVETRNFDIRKNLLKYDDVMNDQRKTIFEQRMEFLTDDDVSDVIEDFRHQVCEDLIEVHVPRKAYAEQWDIEGLDNKTKQLMRISVPFEDWAKEEGIADEEMLERLKNSTDLMYTELTSSLAPEDMQRAEKDILLQVIYLSWREHLQQLDNLKSVIGMRAYGQRDPLNEYKSEAFQLFDNLLTDLREGVTKAITNLLMRVAEQRQVQQAQAQQAPQVTATAAPRSPMDMLTGSGAAAIGTASAASASPNTADITPADLVGVSRNAPCPCGSGKKVKQCHGKV